MPRPTYPNTLKITENVLIGALHDYLLAWIGQERTPQGFAGVPEELAEGLYRAEILPAVTQKMVKEL